MTRVEMWIALALVGLAAVGAAVALVPRSDLLEETCAPALPVGDPAAIDVARDDLALREGVMTRTIEFVADVDVERAVLRACIAKETRVERGGQDVRVRVEIGAWGPDPDRVVEDQEVKLRAAVDDGTLFLVPRIELHTRETMLPRLTLTLVLPSGVSGDVEAWP